MEFRLSSTDTDLWGQIMEMLPILIPLVVIDLALKVTAVIHIVKHKNYRAGNMVVWIIVAVAVNLIGPILYFVIGRGEEEE